MVLIGEYAKRKKINMFFFSTMLNIKAWGNSQIGDFKHEPFQPNLKE